MACRLCRREALGATELCRYHLAAKEALKKGYQFWLEAYQDMSWSAYLNRVKTLEDTGRWVKEVVALEEASSSLV